MSIAFVYVFIVCGVKKMHVVKSNNVLSGSSAFSLEQWSLIYILYCIIYMEGHVLFMRISFITVLTAAY